MIDLGFTCNILFMHFPSLCFALCDLVVPSVVCLTLGTTKLKICPMPAQHYSMIVVGTLLTRRPLFPTLNSPIKFKCRMGSTQTELCTQFSSLDFLSLVYFDVKRTTW